jgi:hypothetical protein
MGNREWARRDAKGRRARLRQGLRRGARRMVGSKTRGARAVKVCLLMERLARMEMAGEIVRHLKVQIFEVRIGGCVKNRKTKIQLAMELEARSAELQSEFKRAKELSAQCDTASRQHGKTVERLEKITRMVEELGGLVEAFLRIKYPVEIATAGPDWGSPMPEARRCAAKRPPKVTDEERLLREVSRGLEMALKQETDSTRYFTSGPNKPSPGGLLGMVER